MDSNQILDSSIVQQEQQVMEHHLASGWKRFANYLIDYVILYIAIIVVLAIYMGANGLTNLGTLEAYLIFIIGKILYYTILESTVGKTIGKMVTQTKVVNNDFSKISFGTAIKRSLCRFIPFEPFSCLGSFPAGWHDSIPDTWVIDEKTIS